MRSLAAALALLALAGCKSTPEEPEKAFQLSGATGTLAGLNGAQSCACKLEWKDLHYTTQRQVLTIDCIEKDSKTLHLVFNHKSPRRNERQLFIYPGGGVLYATLGPSQPDVRGKPYDGQWVLPVYVHLLRVGYEFPADTTGAAPDRPFEAATLGPDVGEVRDGLLWCSDMLDANDLPDGGLP